MTKSTNCLTNYPGSNSSWNMTESNQEKRGVQSVDISGELLEALCSFSGPVPLKEIAKFCDIPASKAHRYLTSLIRIGLAAQIHDSGYYDLGPMALRLGVAAIARDDAIRRASVQLVEITTLTRTTGHLAVWGEVGPIVIRSEHGGPPILSALPLGSIVPLRNTSAGHVFLAYMPASASRTVLDQQRSSPGESAETIELLKTKVAVDGFSRVDGTHFPGLSAISGPTLYADGSLACVTTLIMEDGEMLADGAPAFREFKAMLDRLNAGVRSYNSAHRNADP